MSSNRGAHRAWFWDRPPTVAGYQIASDAICQAGLGGARSDVNRWKAAFVTVLVCWALSVAGLLAWADDLHHWLERARDEGADCATHRDLLHEIARSSANRSDFTSLPPVTRTDLQGRVREVQASEMALEFDAAGRYLGSGFGSSHTPK
jgi:hypothetical protein